MCSHICYKNCVKDQCLCTNFLDLCEHSMRHPGGLQLPWSGRTERVVRYPVAQWGIALIRSCQCFLHYHANASRYCVSHNFCCRLGQPPGLHAPPADPHKCCAAGIVAAHARQWDVVCNNVHNGMQCSTTAGLGLCVLVFWCRDAAQA